MSLVQKINFVNNFHNELKIIPNQNTIPKVDETVFLASGSKIIGDVEIGEQSSVWYNTVIRGDVNYIKIGKLTNVQDNSMLHVTNQKFPLIIGNKVTIGHSVTLHGCIIKDLTLIGIGAVVLDGAIVEEYSVVAAGSVVRPGFIVPSKKLVAGVPAKVVRDLTEDELKEFEISANRYFSYVEKTVNSIYNYYQGN
ncbi:gamma carbonic anhydrase family protein [Stygiobacter electus]|uniref:Gamma carbonic anhydrase family protein n=1 Tax=Stygiobacter electus TaxID=3032292 RepID=A0AAE3P0G2_9BACT|nr:gamma carbonic anhydrase family protein [Stygiobacter electus]MDF1611437.1 gamma carbonic anhydrase family protein [Stygiobacter electus]